jgi:N-formylglutamate amidohydrolase
LAALKPYDLEAISKQLEKGAFPFSGISRLGSAEFHFREPAPYLGVALHAGSRVRPALSGAMAVTRPERLREEDPDTDLFIREFPLQLIARDSRFEYDLNWEPEKSIYAAGEKKWGLQVWNRELTGKEREETSLKYREFHAILDMVLEMMLHQGAPVILFDMHSFCFQREGTVDWFNDAKPEINLGTRHINRRHFTLLVDAFLEEVSGMHIDGHPLRVGENELFSGGYLTRKYAERFNREVLVMAIEYKKIFMDERTAVMDRERFSLLKANFMKTKNQMLKLL